MLRKDNKMTEKVPFDAHTTALKAVEGLEEKKGLDIVLMDLRKLDGAVTDFFVIASGTSDRHVAALADSVEELIKKDLQDRPINIEGKQLGEWVLIDYVNVVVHIFLQKQRNFFRIEELWGDAEIRRIGEAV